MLIPLEGEDHWRDLRATNIGGSEVAALFGCGFQTHFQLWHEKKGTLAPEDFADNERVVLGRCLEDGIANAARDLYGYKLQKANCYLTDDTTPGLGSTPDYWLIRPGNEFPAEIKNASWGQWRDNWITHEDGTVEPPLRYLLQVQVQLACSGREAGLLIALISGDRIVRCEIPRHENSIKEIRHRVTQFWESIRNDDPPPAEMPDDLSAALRVFPGGEGFMDLSGDPDMETWLKQLSTLRADRKRIEADEDFLRGQVLQFCSTHSLASIKANAGRVSCKRRDALPARMVSFKAQPARLDLRITVSGEE